MHLSGRLRSSTALALLMLLLSSTTGPLALCASGITRGPCAPQRHQQARTSKSCHESQAPAMTLSCCCNTADDPASTPAPSILAERALNSVVSVVAVIVPAIQGVPHVLESRVLLSHLRPLFTLYSAFLI